jgi:heme exporter protein D
MSEYFAQYFAMGGYAAFIWPSYGIAALLLVVLFLLSARRLRAAESARPHNPNGDQNSTDDA